MSELKLQIADTRRWLDAIDSAADRGILPELADARLLAKYAAHLESMVWAAHLDALRKRPERSPAEDKASQRYIAPFEDDRPHSREETPDERANGPYNPKDYSE